MDAETEQKLTFMARQIAAEMCRNQGGQFMLPSATAVAAAGLEACGPLLTTNRGAGRLIRHQ